MKISLLVFVSLTLAGIFGLSRSFAAVDATTQLYISTFQTMQNLPQPPFVRYRLVTHNEEGLQVTLSIYNHDVWLSFRPGDVSSEWSVAHRSGDFASAVTDGSGNRYVTDRSFFDPTWYSVYHAMREGMFFDAPNSTQPVQRPIPTPQPSPAASDGGLQTVTTVNSNATLYSVRDGGSTTCPNGDAGHVLLFTPRGSRMQYQMTALIIDRVNRLFCEAAFALPSLDGTPLVDDQYYGEVDGYWVRTGGRFIRLTRVTISNEAPYVPNEPGNTDIDVPQMRSTYTQTSTLAYRFIDMSFPASIPAELFTMPPDQ